MLLMDEAQVTYNMQEAHNEAFWAEIKKIQQREVTNVYVILAAALRDPNHWCKAESDAGSFQHAVRFADEAIIGLHPAQHKNERCSEPAVHH